MKRSRVLSKLLLLSFVSIATVLSVVAQGPKVWQAFSTKDGLVRVALPTSSLVHKDGKRTTIFASSSAAEYTVRIEERDSARDEVKRMKDKGGTITGSEKIEGKNFYFRRYEFQRESTFGLTLYYGKGKAFIAVTVFTDDRQNVEVRKFLSGLALEGVLKDSLATTDPPDVDVSLDISSLESSREIADSLLVPDAPARQVSLGKIQDDKTEFDSRYGRRLIIVSKPSVVYSEKARMEHKEGTIRANVEFLGSGRIGKVTVERKLDDGLVQNVGNAARQIKFVPAQINGQPVDITRVVHYTFSLY